MKNCEQPDNTQAPTYNSKGQPSIAQIPTMQELCDSLKITKHVQSTTTSKNSSLAIKDNKLQWNEWTYTQGYFLH